MRKKFFNLNLRQSCNRLSKEVVESSQKSPGQKPAQSALGEPALQGGLD